MGKGCSWSRQRRLAALIIFSKRIQSAVYFLGTLLEYRVFEPINWFVETFKTLLSVDSVETVGNMFHAQKMQACPVSLRLHPFVLRIRGVGESWVIYLITNPSDLAAVHLHQPLQINNFVINVEADKQSVQTAKNYSLIEDVFSS